MAECHFNVSFPESEDHRYSTTSWSFQVLFTPLVTIFGILCNSTFIYTVYRIRFMHTITNIYLVNLAVADSILLIAAFSQYISDYINCPTYDLQFSMRTTFGCVASNLFIYTFYYASLWTIVLVAIERYLASHRIVGHRKVAIFSIVIVWVISLAFGSIAAPGVTKTVCIVSSPEGDVIRIPRCSSTCESCDLALYLTDLIQFVVALILNIIFYTLIVHKVSGSSFATQDDVAEEDIPGFGSRARNKIITMLIINGVVFFVCLAPFSVVNLHSVTRNIVGSTFMHKQVSNIVAWVGRILFLINSAVNPLVYNATNPRYRLAFRRAFCFRDSKNASAVASRDSLGSQTTKMWHFDIPKPLFEQILIHVKFGSKFSFSALFYLYATWLTLHIDPCFVLQWPDRDSVCNHTQSDYWLDFR